MQLSTLRHCISVKPRLSNGNAAGRVSPLRQKLQLAPNSGHFFKIMPVLCFRDSLLATHAICACDGSHCARSASNTVRTNSHKRGQATFITPCRHSCTHCGSGFCLLLCPRLRLRRFPGVLFCCFFLRIAHESSKVVRLHHPLHRWGIRSLICLCFALTPTQSQEEQKN